MSMEFLVGTSLRNNLYNLGMESVFKSALKQKKIDINSLYAMEPDAGLGNGGLGRLASCYMDAMTSLGMMGTGFFYPLRIRYFSSRKIVDGWQMEFPDNWLEMGDVWLNRREDESFIIKFGGTLKEEWTDGKLKVTHENYQPVMAVPYDMYISGYDTDAVNKLVFVERKNRPTTLI
ncbi:MAG: glycogen/starch/alpha-glucan phosphorylase [Clostridiales bacterium]|nr:MAG: glycogen/starch/alpha-glucan phosphorylase [Clostridiales bacterium]